MMHRALRLRITRISTGMLRLLEDAEDANQDLEEEYTESNDLYSVRVPGQVRCYFNACSIKSAVMISNQVNN